MVYIYHKIFSNNIRYKEHEGLTYLNKKNNYIFTDNIWEINNNWSKPDEKEYKNYLTTYKKLMEYANSNKIPFFIIAIPTKEKVLIKYQDENIKSYKNETERIVFIKEYLKKNTKMDNIFYPVEELSQENDLTYYKTDHHYTDYGAVVVAQAFFKKYPINGLEIKYFKNFQYAYGKKPRGTWDDEEFNGSLYQRLNIHNEKIFDTDYKYFDLNKTNIKIDKNDNIYKIKYKNIDAPNNLKGYIIGDSFVHSFGKCLAYSFKNLIVRRDNIENHKLYANELFDDIKKEKPDFLIFVYTAAHIDRFLKTFYSAG